MPVEAMAAGCPVIVNRVGGTSESVMQGVAGFQLDIFTGADMASAISYADKLNPAEIQLSVSRFDSSIFRTALGNWIGHGKNGITTPTRELASTSSIGTGLE